MSPASLPQELISLILSFLFHVHDKPTLSSCSLVSKAWLSLSRTHLFHDITLNNRNHPQILLSPYTPTLAAYTRRLKIARLNIASPSFPPSPFPPFSDTLFQIQRFSAITSLMLQRTAPSKNMLLALPPLFPEVRHLYLDAVNFPTSAEAYTFFCAFGRLEKVTVSHTWDQSKSTQREPLYFPPGVRGVDARGGLFFLKVPVPVSVKGGEGLGYGGVRVRVLRLGGLRIRDAAAIAPHLEAIGKGLEHLELGFVAYSAAEVFHNKIDLSSTPNLRSFALLRAPPKLLLSALRSAAPLQKLEEATLTMHSMLDEAQIVRVLTTFDWATLDALTGDALRTPRLHNVTLRLEESLRTRVHERVKGGMRMSVGRKVLELRFVGALREACEWEEQIMQDPFGTRWTTRYERHFRDVVSVHLVKCTSGAPRTSNVRCLELQLELKETIG
ncbi:hypothetical protein D9615_007146 [Tricholomella constricta]|uniref:F-box domain-containing protein n=1 Tax=Tricholomella constricta TaxID=117010 RepID=A0A8H5H8A4_9AGAR|nr:hypothetical protein D9615_007146 [Tricholomella constricta]